MNKQVLYAGERYRHYKGKLYQIVAVAMHTETEEELVIYQALYGDYKIYARPLKMFFETVQDAEGNAVPRFVKECGCTKDSGSVACENGTKAESVGVQPEIKAEVKIEKAVVEPEEEKITDIPPVEGINPLLIEFLDAESSAERLEVLHRMRKSIDHKTISDIAAALDIVIEEKDMDERIKDLETCLQTRARFETTRLR